MCKCHGASGSCSTKTCWKALPSFQVIGDHLMTKYTKAKKVTPFWSKRSRIRHPVFLQISQRNYIYPFRKPKIKDLIYLENSPNYCDQDKYLGSYGTRGRICNKTMNQSESCDNMCCGRGYNTHHQMRIWKCQCKFIWCCYVDCKDCIEKSEFYSCK